MAKEQNTGTPFDDVFKTETVRLKQFLLPLINELYGTKYDPKLVEVVREPNEHYISSEIDDTGIPKRLTDSCIRIMGKLYHVECQSTEDGNILVRLVEYNMQIGFENAAVDEKDKVVVDLPMTALIMLRQGGDEGVKKTTKKIVYRYEEQEITITVPVMNVQAYSADEIYEKRLFFLVPFYAIRYEKYFDPKRKGGLDADKEYDKIRGELEDWSSRLIDAYESGVISEDEGRKLTELSQLILRHIARKLKDEIAEGMVNTMGGKVLELPSDKMYAEAVRKGEQKGKCEGKKEGADMLAALLRMLKPGSVEFDRALNATDEERQELYAKYNISL